MDGVSVTIEGSVGLLSREKGGVVVFHFGTVWNYRRNQEVEIVLGIGMMASEKVLPRDVIFFVKSN